MEICPQSWQELMEHPIEGDLQARMEDAALNCTGEGEKSSR